MIHVVSVAELVDQDIINQLIGEFHERDIEANRASAAAAPPPSTGMAKTDALVG